MENQDNFTDGPFGFGLYEDKQGPWKQEDTERILISHIRDHNTEKNSPHDLTGLSWKLPRLRDGFVVVGTFNVNDSWPPEKIVGCALAIAKGDKSHPARSGSVVWFSDGFLRLVGPDCTKKHFLDAFGDFERSKRDLSKMKTRLTHESVLLKTIPHLDNMRAEINQLQQNSFVRRFDLTKKQFTQHMNDVWNRMVMTASDAGMMQIEYSKSDGAFHQAGGGGKSIGRVQYQNYGILGGQAIFNKLHTTPSIELEKALNQIDIALSFKNAVVEELTSQEIKKANTSVNNAVEAVNQACQLLDAMRELMSPQNLTNLIKFMNALDGGQERYRLLQNGIQSVHGDRKIAITLDSHFVTPQAPEIRKHELRRLS